MASSRLVLVAWLGATAALAAQSTIAGAPRPADGRQIIASASSLGQGLPSAAALAELRGWNRLVTDGWLAGEFTRVTIEDDPLMPERRHERFRQTHLGVPIWGGDVRRQINTFGQTESIFGTYYPDVDVDVTPGTTAPGGATLEILPTDRGFRLTWMTRAGSETAGARRWIFTDATSGDLLFTYDDACARQAVERAGAQPSIDAGDAESRTARAALDVISEYFLRRFGRRDLPTVGASTLSAGVEAGAHAVSHGVIAATSGLVHYDDAGRLDEAFADIIGVSAKAFAQPSVTDEPARSNVVGAMFALAIAGGATGADGVTVDGVGAGNRDQIERVVYRAFTMLLPARATVAMARAATLQAALDLYGADSRAMRAIAQAWTAVGVEVRQAGS